MAEPLPVDAAIPQILDAIGTHGNVVIEAPPGAGKTTRVPPALLDVVEGSVLVLEPRRIAARMAARRVAEERGEPLGETAGYQVRFEEVAGPNTRLLFVTEGVLTRRLLADNSLRGAGAVVLDEFHERHLEGDLALALLRRLQLTLRPDLKLAVMSATLDASPVAAYLGDCPVVRSEGRRFEVEIRYTPHSAAPLEEQVRAAVQSLASETGDILVFLPGAAEIRRAARACQTLAARLGLLVLPLHGDLPPEEQDRAVRRSEQRKLILSTNVAESSITIDGVTAVVDSGLARMASDSPATGLPTLEVRRISKASAAQRAGRAGRTGPGRAIRLYPLEDYLRRPDHDLPEVRRRDLSQVVLELRALGVDSVPWFEPPPQEGWRAAEELLDRLGAREDPRALAAYPVHPRLARLLVEAVRRRVTAPACRLAALLSSGERLVRVEILDSIEGEPSFRVRQIERQLRRMTPNRRGGSDDDLRMCLLAAYPDRVGRRRSGRDVRLCGGRTAALAGDTAADLLVAIDIEDRRESGPPLIRACTAIRAEWLLDLFPERISASEEVVWNRTAERVEGRSAILYDDLPIEESATARPDPEQAARLLAERAIEAGLHRFADVAEVEQMLERIRFAARYAPVRELSVEDVRDALAGLCAGLRSFPELKQAAGGGALLALLKARAGNQHLLEQVAPERIRLKQRQVRVHYEAGQPPWIESRLQDFFGVEETPRIAGGQVPVVVRLLAPNHRPVQTTTDLKGFWERLYPQVRRELSRRYPKHAWPEKPELATQ